MQKNATETNFPDAKPEDIPALKQIHANTWRPRQSLARPNNLALTLVFFTILFSTTFRNFHGKSQWKNY